MNSRIYNYFLSLSNSKIPDTLLPHQIATLDFLLRKCYHDKESVLLYHKMGSGKTILTLSFALLVSKTHKVLIVVPNNSVGSLVWMGDLNKVLSILPHIEFNLENIQIKSRTKFMEEVDHYNSSLINKVQIYDDYFIIIDEAHNIFGNNSGINIIKIRKSINSVFILLTGSPISNTVEPLKDMLIILKNDKNFNNNYIQKGKKVFEIKLTEEGKKYVENQLKGYVSYYNQESNLIPNYYYIGRKLIYYPVVFCEMSELQLKWYDIAKKSIKENEEMFSKIMLNASFCVLGEIDNYININNLIGTYKELLPNLNISGNILIGSELVTLNISSKFKYFRNKYISNMEASKKFIYFSNSKIGTLIIRSIMRANGISEYNKDIVNNYRCVNCNLDHSCPKLLNKLCKPAKFFIITSNEMNNDTMLMTNIIQKFNSFDNINGENLMFLFGSKIMSESHTLTEIKHIIFLTVPDTKAELNQTTARALRSFSYSNIKDTEITIEILLCVNGKSSIIKNLIHEKESKYLNTSLIYSNSKIIENYIKMLNDIDSKLDYDLRKILYLEVKSSRSDDLLKILKKSHINYDEGVVNELKYIVYIETLKRYFYTNKYIINIDNVFNISKILTEKDLNEFLNKLENIIVYNDEFRNSTIIKINNISHLIPLKILQKKYLMSLNINDF